MHRRAVLDSPERDRDPDLHDPVRDRPHLLDRPFQQLPPKHVVLPVVLDARELVRGRVALGDPAECVENGCLEFERVQVGRVQRDGGEGGEGGGEEGEGLLKGGG